MAFKKYGVEPDVAIYSKTLGNGYAIAAIVGRRIDASRANHLYQQHFFGQNVIILPQH